ncbi:MAG: TetR/AcrR family transcriptional regulator [Aliihoeflea sp.]|uniref:TetR/AcrR family transcriptional regulator n=1 Tax=Aliihoeflea sp. TaxID=2608088 RepID=UPI0040344F3F
MKLPVGRPSSRQRILEAAEALAREQGPGNISLDAVAARAGLSKGGLLYNFPTKAKLLEALVEMHIERAEAALAQSVEAGPKGRNAMALAYLRYCRQEMIDRPEPASGVLAAIAENPEFIDPVRRYQKQVMERLRERSADFELSTIAFLAIEGFWSLRLMESDCIRPDEIQRVLDRLERELEGAARPTTV